MRWAVLSSQSIGIMLSVSSQYSCEDVLKVLGLTEARSVCKLHGSRMNQGIGERNKSFHRYLVSSNTEKVSTSVTPRALDSVEMLSTDS
jgi:hypothetical protein